MGLIKTTWAKPTWASLVAQMVKNLPAIRETWVHSMGWEDPMEKGTATHSSIWGWIFFLTFIVKMSPHTQELKDNAVLWWTHRTISIAINMVPELFHQLPHPKNMHILFNFAGIF